MVGSLPTYCERAVSGHATVAPPSADMNCRRPMLIAILSFPKVVMPAAIWPGYQAPIGRQ